jgi:hypothetical protein
MAKTLWTRGRLIEAYDQALLGARGPTPQREQSMTVTLASNSDDRAIAIRDRILPLLREHGVVQLQRDSVRLTELRMGVWTFRHWTPFNELARGEASSPGYRHAIGLDVWHVAKVLHVLWSHDGTIDVVGFVRGPWEDESLIL